MASIKVHGLALSVPTCKVLACLYEKDLEFEFINVKMHEAEHKKPHFLSINVKFPTIPMSWVSLLFMVFC